MWLLQIGLGEPHWQFSLLPLLQKLYTSGSANMRGPCKIHFSADCQCTLKKGKRWLPELEAGGLFGTLNTKCFSLHPLKLKTMRGSLTRMVCAPEQPDAGSLACEKCIHFNQ